MKQLKGKRRRVARRLLEAPRRTRHIVIIPRRKNHDFQREKNGALLYFYRVVRKGNLVRPDSIHYELII